MTDQREQAIRTEEREKVRKALFDQDAIDDGDGALMVRAEKGWHFVPDFASGLKVAWETALASLPLDAMEEPENSDAGSPTSSEPQLEKAAAEFKVLIERAREGIDADAEALEAAADRVTGLPVAVIMGDRTLCCGCRRPMPVSQPDDWIEEDVPNGDGEYVQFRCPDCQPPDSLDRGGEADEKRVEYRAAMGASASMPTTSLEQARGAAEYFPPGNVAVQTRTVTETPWVDVDDCTDQPAPKEEDSDA